jgi:hypothetical protein
MPSDDVQSDLACKQALRKIYSRAIELAQAAQVSTPKPGLDMEDNNSATTPVSAGAHSMLDVTPLVSVLAKPDSAFVPDDVAGDLNC